LPWSSGCAASPRGTAVGPTLTAKGAVNTTESVRSTLPVLSLATKPTVLMPLPDAVMCTESVSSARDGTSWVTCGASAVFALTTTTRAFADAAWPFAVAKGVMVTELPAGASGGSVTSAVAVLTVASGASGVIAQWNFNSAVPDANTATGTTSTSAGSGTASLVGGATATYATGDTALDPAGSTDNSGWNTANYPAQGAGNKTRGVQFNVSTAGRQNIVVSWTSQCSNTGSKYAHLQYSTNGTDFIDFPTAVTNTTSFVSKTNSLAAIPGVNDNPNFAFRILAEFESSAINTLNANYVAANTSSSYGPAGTIRYDMVTVSGSAIVTAPPSPPVLSSPAIISGNQFQFTVTGTTGSSYIIQVSTNLAGSNWISLFTNTAPFTFANSNASAFPQGFYRAISSP